jgi:hypothetical protein
LYLLFISSCVEGSSTWEGFKGYEREVREGDKGLWGREQNSMSWLYTKNWQEHAQHSEVYVGRGR